MMDMAKSGAKGMLKGAKAAAAGETWRGCLAICLLGYQKEGARGVGEARRAVGVRSACGRHAVGVRSACGRSAHPPPSVFQTSLSHRSFQLALLARVALPTRVHNSLRVSYATHRTRTFAFVFAFSFWPCIFARVLWGVTWRGVVSYGVAWRGARRKSGV